MNTKKLLDEALFKIECLVPTLGLVDRFRGGHSEFNMAVDRVKLAAEAVLIDFHTYVDQTLEKRTSHRHDWTSAKLRNLQRIRQMSEDGDDLNAVSLDQWLKARIAGINHLASELSGKMGTGSALAKRFDTFSNEVNTQLTKAILPLAGVCVAEQHKVTAALEAMMAESARDIEKLYAHRHAIDQGLAQLEPLLDGLPTYAFDLNYKQFQELRATHKLELMRLEAADPRTSQTMRDRLKEQLAEHDRKYAPIHYGTGGVEHADGTSRVLEKTIPLTTEKTKAARPSWVPQHIEDRIAEATRKREREAVRERGPSMSM